MKRFGLSRFPAFAARLSLFAVSLLALCLCASIPARAAAYVFSDNEETISAEESAALEARAEEIAETYDFGVYLAIVNNYEDYGFDDVYDCAVQFYKEHDLGLGGGKDGELLFMSMENRRFATVYHGYGDTAFTEYGRDLVENAFLAQFRDDNWYGGFSDYLEESAYLLSVAAAGTPLGWEEYGAEHPDDAGGSYKGFDLVDALIALAGGGGISGLICGGIATGMKSVRPAAQARQYALPDSLKLRVKNDSFTHTTETRVKVKSESHSDGGSHHHSGGGFSGRSGGF